MLGFNVIYQRNSEIVWLTQLVVDNIVSCESHAEEGAGGMKVGWHAGPRIYILADSSAQIISCVKNKEFNPQNILLINTRL